jgi:hypothetical protein
MLNSRGSDETHHWAGTAADFAITASGQTRSIWDNAGSDCGVVRLKLGSAERHRGIVCGVSTCV